MVDKVTFERIRAFHKGEGELNAMLDAFGEDLAKKMGYQHLNGIEAIHLYLIQKHHWLPSVVRSLSYEDLQFALHEEMQGWTLPEDLRE